jgi:hypothetical protein
MIPDILCVNNFFDDPHKIVELAKKQKYYLTKDNPSMTNPKFGYSGIRTLHISDILSEELCYDLNNKIVSKLFKDSVPSKIKLQSICLFHCLFDTHIPDNSWVHKDTSLYSGLIYLNENFVDKFNNHGTKIYKNGEETNISYEFNKMILYRGDYFHSPNFGFGQSIDDCRLSLNFFINEINIDMKNLNRVKEKHYDYET